MKIVGHFMGATVVTTLLFYVPMGFGIAGVVTADAATTMMGLAMIAGPILYAVVAYRMYKRKQQPRSCVRAPEARAPIDQDRVRRIYGELRSQPMCRKRPWRKVWREAERRAMAEGSVTSIASIEGGEEAREAYRPDPGFVYVMQLGDMSITKLGVSHDEHGRVRQHERHGWTHVRTWETYDYAEALEIEKAVHDHAERLGARLRDESVKIAMPQGGYTEAMTFPPAYVISLVSGLLEQAVAV